MPDETGVTATQETAAGVRHDGAEGSEAAADALLAGLLGPDETGAATEEAPVADAESDTSDLSQREEGDSPEAEATDGEGEEEPAPEDDEPTGKVPYKRLAKEVARRKELEARLAAVEAKLTEAQKPSEQVPEYDLVGRDPELRKFTGEEAKLRAELQHVQDLKKLSRTAPDKAAEWLQKMVPNLGDYSPEAIRDWADDYAESQREKLTDLRTQTAQRRAQIETNLRQERQRNEAAVQQYTPWLGREDDPRQSLRQNLRKQMADFSGHPAMPIVEVALAEWLHKVQVAQRTKTKPAATAAPNRVQPTAATSASRGAGKPVNAREAALKRLQENPTDDTLAEALEHI